MRLDPANPSSFLSALQNSGWFAATEVLNEDRNRTISYQQQQQRQSLRSELSLHDYLKSLETVATLREATAVDLPRVSQMSQKTNQFNLTTERLTDGDIDSALEAGEHFFVLELCDRYGDLGIVGYAHLRTDAERKHGELCNFALSCRALGREVEDLFLFALLDHWQLSLKRIDARWRRSGKNQQTKHFYERCGFCFLHHSETERHYSLELGSTMLPPRPSSITLIDQLEPLNGN
jgi:FkbH-like protein